jgi:hypothetical protein
MDPPAPTSATGHMRAEDAPGKMIKVEQLRLAGGWSAGLFILHAHLWLKESNLKTDIRVDGDVQHLAE